MKHSAYYENLIKTVIDNSVHNSWDDAVLEWEIDDCQEDESLQASCICGKEHLRYLFTIRNSSNGQCLYPIGSSCIHKFERGELNDIASVSEQLFKLLHAIEHSTFISLSSDFFSRKLLKYLHDEGIFKENEYNNYNAKADYLFLLEMFNKRDKNSITPAQQKKISAIIVNSIKPFLRGRLQDKILKAPEIGAIRHDR